MQLPPGTDRLLCPPREGRELHTGLEGDVTFGSSSSLATLAVEPQGSGESKGSQLFVVTHPMEGGLRGTALDLGQRTLERLNGGQNLEEWEMEVRPELCPSPPDTTLASPGSGLWRFRPKSAVWGTAVCLRAHAGTRLWHFVLLQARLWPLLLQWWSSKQWGVTCIPLNVLGLALISPSEPGWWSGMMGL